MAIRVRCGWVGVDAAGRCYRCNMVPTSADDECPLGENEIPKAFLLLFPEPSNDDTVEAQIGIRATEIAQLVGDIARGREIAGWLAAALDRALGDDEDPKEIAGWLAYEIENAIHGDDVRRAADLLFPPGL